MSRPSSPRSLNVERLESREVMAAGGPSAQAQYMLELVNQARTNPGADCRAADARGAPRTRSDASPAHPRARS